MAEQIYRLHYRGQLKEGIPEEEIPAAAEQCLKNVRQAQRQGRVLTAALYRWNRMLFFYYEAIGEKLPVREASDREQEGDALIETGEDVQLTCLHPEELLVPFAPLMQVWPGQQDDRLWVHMYHIYYHSVPESVSQWRRAAVPEMRRGRIAFLREDKLFEYVYYHCALVDEGLLQGDKYQSIALHENILFSYFEEPKTMTNIRKDPEQKSRVIEQWHAVNPKAHFIRQPEGEGLDFMFLPALFAAGVEEEEGNGQSG